MPQMNQPALLHSSSSSASEDMSADEQRRLDKLESLRALSRTQYIVSCAVEAGAAALVFAPVYFAYHVFDGALSARVAPSSSPPLIPQHAVQQ